MSDGTGPIDSGSTRREGTPREPGRSGATRPTSRHTPQEPTTLASVLEGLSTEQKDDVTKILEALRRIEETLAADDEVIARLVGDKEDSTAAEDNPDAEMQQDMIVFLAKCSQKALREWTERQLHEEFRKWKDERPGVNPELEKKRVHIKNLFLKEIDRRRKEAQERKDLGDTSVDPDLIFGQIYNGKKLPPEIVTVIELDVNKLREDRASAEAYVRRKVAEYLQDEAEQEAHERAEVERLEEELRRQPKRTEEVHRELDEELELARRYGSSRQAIREKEKRTWIDKKNDPARKREAKLKAELEAAEYQEKRAKHAKSDFRESGEGSDPEGSFDEKKARKEVAGPDSTRAVPGALGSESRIDMKDESMLPPGHWDDYYVEKDKLLRPHKATGEPTRSWKEYGWSDEDRREMVEWMEAANDISGAEAYNILAALVLHGNSADDVRGHLLARERVPGSHDYYNNLDGLVKRLKLARNDDEVMDIVYGAEKGEMINNLTVLQPDSLEDLAYQIMYADSRTNRIFHRRNAIALLTNKVQLRTDAEGNKRFKFVEEVNADAIFGWFIASAMEAHGNATTKALDFEKEISVEKSGISSPLTIYTMMAGRYGRMFLSRETGHQHAWIADQLEAIANFLSETRNCAIEIQAAMGDKKQLEQTRGAQLIFNNMVRSVGGVSLTEMLLKLSELGNRKEGGDRKVGAAMLTKYMAYCNMADMDELAKVLDFGREEKYRGKEADDPKFKEMFSLDALRKARDDSLKGRRKGGKTDIPAEKKEDKWRDLSHESIFEKGLEINGVKLKDIFNEDGTPKLPEKRYEFMQFINFFTHVTPDERLENMVRGIIANRVNEIHGIRETKDGMDIPGIGDFMDMVSHGLTYRFGMYYMLDVMMSGRSEEGKVNARYLRDRSKKDAHSANLYQLAFMFPQMLPPEALVVSTTTIDPRTGKPMNIQNAMKAAYEERITLERRLTKAADAWFESTDPAIREVREKRIAEKLLKIKEHMQRKKGETDAEYAKRLHEDFGDISEEALLKKARKEVKLDYRDSLLKKEEFIKGKEAYDDAASALAFNGAVERNYYQDSWQKGFHMDERYTGAKQLHFEKYVKIDAYGGATVDMAEWTAECAKFFNQMRKFLGGTKFSLSTPVQQWNEGTQKMEWVTMGETVIGKQVLNYLLKDPKFWKVNERTGKHEVDWEALGHKEVHLEKWMEIGFITGQMLQYAEKAEWNLNPRYAYSVKAAIVQAIRHMPGEFMPNPNDARAGESKNYFDKEMIDWFREKAGIKNMFWTEMVANLFGGAPGKKNGLWSGFGAMFAQLLKAINIH